MQNNDVKQLIQSIRSQTDKLKNRVKNTVPAKTSAKTSTSKKDPSEQHESSESSNKHYSFKNVLQRDPIFVYQTPHGEEKANEEEPSFLTPKITNLPNNENKLKGKPSHPGSLNFKTSQKIEDHNGPELQQVKKMLQSLAMQNEILTNDLKDFKRALEIMISSYKKVQKELDEEKRKNARFRILEFEINQEREKIQKLREKNSFLKSKYLKLIQTAHQYCLDNDQEYKDMEVDLSKLESENHVLREVLLISHSNETEIEEKIESALKDLEKHAPDELNQSQSNASSIPQNWLDDFRKQKEERKNLKIIEDARKKEKELSSNQDTINIATFGMVDMFEDKMLETKGVTEIKNLQEWKAGPSSAVLQKGENIFGEGNPKGFDAKSFLSNFKN